MAATTDGNQNYKRYTETPGVEATQPTTTAGTVDPGSTWETKPYLNFNGDYKRYEDTPGDEASPQPDPNGEGYVRYSDTPGVPAPPPQPYVRTP